VIKSLQACFYLRYGTVFNLGGDYTFLSFLFCSDCVDLLKQMKKPNDELQIVSCQIEQVVLKVMSNYDATLNSTNYNAAPPVHSEDDKYSQPLNDLRSVSIINYENQLTSL